MTCPQQSEQLDSYLDGESEPAFSSWFETHQMECARCRSLVHFHRNFKGMLRESMNSEKTPDLVRQRLLRALNDSTGVKTATGPSVAWHRRPWVKPMLAAASLAAVSTAAWVGLTQNSPHPYALAMSKDHTRCCSEVASREAQPPKFGSVAPPAPLQNPGQLCKSKLGAEPTVAKFPTLHECDVKMCPIQDHQALHLIYEDGDKNMVSMFGLPENSEYGGNLPDAANGIKPAMFAANDHNLAAWKKQGWVYSMVAAMPQDRLSHMAEQGTYTASMNSAWLAQNSMNQPYPGEAQMGGFGTPIQPVAWTH